MQFDTAGIPWLAQRCKTHVRVSYCPGFSASHLQQDQQELVFIWDPGAYFDSVTVFGFVLLVTSWCFFLEV